MNDFKDMFGRLRQSRRWVLAQFVLTALLILVGIAWTRLPEKHVWQVALSLLLPLLLAISALELQAGTVRSLADDDGKRVKLVWGAMTLLVWIAVAWVAWALLDWCDDQIPQWAGYLNSQAPAHARARLFTYEHIILWMTILEWVLRWVVVPAKVIPYAAASAQWGLRLPWRRALHLLWNWRWWLAVALAALASVWLPERFFTGMPSGTVSAQIWHVTLKLAGAYLLVVGSWVLLLGWVAVLFGRQQPLPENDDATELFSRLRTNYRWVAALAAWTILNSLQHRFFGELTGHTALSNLLLALWELSRIMLLFGLMRSLLTGENSRTRVIWTALSFIVWVVVALSVWYMMGRYAGPATQWMLGTYAVPALFIPIAAVSAQYGFRLPWRRVLGVLRDGYWWIATLMTVVIGDTVSSFIVSIAPTEQPASGGWYSGVLHITAFLWSMICWILLFGWFSVLFTRRRRPAGEAFVPIPAPIRAPEPVKQNSVKPPLSEGS